MKKMLVVIIVLIVSASSLAGRKTPQVDIRSIKSHLAVTGEDQLSLFLKNPKATAIIRLEDSAGNLIYKNRVFSKKQVELPFDVSLLKTGEYRFTIKIGQKEVYKTFFLQTKTRNIVRIIS